MNHRRGKRHHLLALAVFLLPLCILAWTGAAELQRLEQRATDSLQRRAANHLRRATSNAERRLTALTEPLLAADFGSGDASDVLESLHRAAPSQPELLALFLREDGNLLDPVSPPKERIAMPRPERPRGALAVLPQLIADERFEDARDLLTFELDQDAPEDWRLEDDAWTWFMLGGVLRRLGEPDAAYQRFTAAAEALEFLGSTRPSAAIEAFALMNATALAETGRPQERLKLLRELARGQHDSLPEAMISATAERLVERCIADGATSAVESALALNENRLRGRRFAADYDVLTQETVRRRLSRGEPVTMVYPGDTPPTLLALRQATLAESVAHGCDVVGVRLDLTLALEEEIQSWFAIEDGFGLEVLDAEGVPIFGGLAPESQSPPNDVAVGFVVPTRTVAGVLRFRVWPTDLELALSEERASSFRRTILFVSICALVALSVFFAWRALRRETELARLKVDLLSRVSHELRTPLSLIRMYAETLGLGRASSPDDLRRFSGIIVRESDRMTQLVERILDVSKKESGTLDYHPSLTDVSQLVDRVTENYKPHIQADGAAIQTSIAPDLHAVVDGDGLQGALLNLLENAVKYGCKRPSSEGPKTPEIHVGLVATGSMLHLTVRDPGPGIPDDQLDAVFESFQRASNAGEVRGAGLGLALVKHFAESHGGQISAKNITDSEPNGLLVEMRLPAVDPTTHITANPSSAVETQQSMTPSENTL